MALRTSFNSTPSSTPLAFREVITLEDGERTTVNYVKYPRSAFRAQVVTLDEPMPLLAWCAQKNVTEAINGGFFRRPTATDTGKILGEVHINGRPIAFDPFGKQWASKRGSIHVNRRGELLIAPRERLPEIIDGDLLQAGPTLVHAGSPTYTTLTCDPEGFSLTTDEHDAYINADRFPRAAIGYDQDHIVTVTVDGRSPHDAGLYLHEMADFLHARLGLEYALNLDGGSSSSLVSSGRLLNRPRTDFEESPHGFPIYSALVLQPHV